MRVGKWHVSPGFMRGRGGADLIKWRTAPWGVELEVTRTRESTDPTKLPISSTVVVDVPWKVLAQMLMTRDERDV